MRTGISIRLTPEDRDRLLALVADRNAPHRPAVRRAEPGHADGGEIRAYRAHLKWWFTRATGYTPVKYVHSIKIEEAKQMLETTQKSIDDVAASVGCEDTGFFRRLFKRLAGITPTQYRKRFQTGRSNTPTSDVRDRIEHKSHLCQYVGLDARLTGAGPSQARREVADVRRRSPSARKGRRCSATK